MCAVLLTVVTALAGVPELTEPQRAMLEGVNDRTSAIDGAGLYALLANARHWPDGADAEAGAMIPDYPAIRTDPAAHRGRRFVIEGKLVSLGTRPLLSRTGYDGVEPWHIEVGPEHFVTVYLTAPPAVAIRRETDGHRIPQRAGENVRIIGRFYKLQAAPNTQGEPQLYQVFVGNTARLTGQSSDAINPALLRSVAIVAVVVLMLATFVVIRMSLTRSRPSARRARSAVEQEHTAQEELDIRDDLPDDPVDALGVLTGEKEEERKHIVNPLEAAMAEPTDPFGDTVIIDAEIDGEDEEEEPKDKP